MIHNREEEILDHIAHEITPLVPEFQEELWNRPVPSASSTEWYLDSSVSHTPGGSRKYLVSTIAACLVLCMFSVFLFQLLPSASIYLDVNPSVTLRVNYRNRVTKAVACNEDAEKILADMDLRGADLDAALYAILGSMVHHGYLTEAKNTVLISVHSGNENRAKELRAEVACIVNQNLDTMLCAGEVLSQEIDEQSMDPDLNATTGKAAFIEKLKDEYPQLKKENLLNMTMDEIVSLLTKENLDYSDYLDDDGAGDDDTVDDDDDAVDAVDAVDADDDDCDNADDDDDNDDADDDAEDDD